ncbi:unnamed protein product, partial [marine sediment metagenome]
NVNLVFIVSDRVTVLYKGKIIEMGTSQELSEVPLHPYTQRLLGIVSPAERRIKNLTETNLKEEIKVYGSICPFFYKCEKRIEICKKNSPILTKVSNTHLVNCHRVIDGEVDNESTSISH